MACGNFAALSIWFGVVGLATRLLAGEGPPQPADDAWQKLVAAENQLNQTEFPVAGSKEYGPFLARFFQKAGELADQFKVYQHESTNSVHQADAWEKWMDWLGVAASGIPARKAELERAEQQCLNDPKLDPNRRESILENKVHRVGDIKEMERLIRELKDQSADPDNFFCQNMVDVADFSPYPHSREVVDEVLSVTAGRENTRLKVWREKALEQKARLDRLGHPLELKFIALDGTAVDLASLRGKVVLLEFWATWCPPCVAGISHVRSVWRALHQEGFEVIGLSYDTDREKLEKFLKKQDVSWPQFFTTAGWDALLIKEFGRPGPPAYWLIDQQGLLVDVVANQDLEGKVKRLLALKNGATPKVPFDK